MSPTPTAHRAAPSHSRSDPRPAVWEGLYNTVLAVLLGAAVLLFIAGGTSSSLQVLWSYALGAVAVSAAVFFTHLSLQRRH